MIQVVIADDHTMFREGLRGFLAEEEGLAVVGEAGTGREAVKLCKELRPDILLLDIDMPEGDGFEVTRQIVSLGLPTRIIVLTMHTNEEFAIRLLQAGASGFLVKYSSSGVIPEAIKKVMKGDNYLPPDITDKMTARLLKSDKTNPAESLTDRELQVFIAIADGKEIKEIAENLCISPRTVETHKSRIMGKLGLRNVAELVKLAIRSGLIKEY